MLYIFPLSTGLYFELAKSPSMTSSSVKFVTSLIVQSEPASPFAVHLNRLVGLSPFSFRQTFPLKLLSSERFIQLLVPVLLGLNWI